MYVLLVDRFDANVAQFPTNSLASSRIKVILDEQFFEHFLTAFLGL